MLSACFLLCAGSAAAAGFRASVGWGSNGHYELGAGYRNGVERSPVSVLQLTNIRTMVAAGQTSYALLSDNRVRSWGANIKEELGDGVGAMGSADSSREVSPEAVPVLMEAPGGQPHELTGVTAIAAAYGAGTHALALVKDKEHPGEVFTWGAGEYGELGDGESGYEADDSPRPRDVAMSVPGLRHVVAIAAGGNSDFALQEETGASILWAWGENLNGKLGTGETGGPTTCRGEGGAKPCATSPVKVELPTGVKVDALAAASQSAYALLTNGAVLAWGLGSHGQLGSGTTETVAVPEYVCAVGASPPCGSGSSYLRGITAISAGALFVLALTDRETVVGWGANADGQLTGSSSGECSARARSCQQVPKQASALEGVSAIAAGQGFGLALSGGTVYAFGEGEGGHLGDGLLEGPETCPGEVACSRAPVPIAGLPPVGGITAGGGEVGEAHSFAYLVSGSGPAPLLSVTPEPSALKVTWTAPGEEHRLTYRLDEPGEEAEASSPVGTFKESCSATNPCSHEISPLAAGRYLVKLVSYDYVGGKRKLVPGGERATLATVGG